MIARAVSSFAHAGKVWHTGTSGLVLSHGCAIVATGRPARPAMEDQDDAERGSTMLSVAVLEADGGGLAELLAGQNEVVIKSANSVPELVILVAAGTFDAVLVAPELPEAWPTSVALEVADALGAALPVLIVCRSDHDRQATSRAVAGRADVIARGALDRESLMMILTGEVTKHRAAGASA